jgi:hypothetical protein
MRTLEPRRKAGLFFGANEFTPGAVAQQHAAALLRRN